MVLAAPLFLFSQTRSLRAFFEANRQAFVNVSFGVSAAYLGVQTYAMRKERTQLADELAAHRSAHAEMVAAVTAPSTASALEAALGAWGIGGGG